MSTSPLSPDDIRAAAEAHRELGPEYSDEVVASFLDKVDREVAARVEARLASTPQAAPANPDNSHALLKGMAIGIAVSSFSSLLIVMSGNVVEARERIGIVLILWLALAAACAVGAARARQRSSRQAALPQSPRATAGFRN
jgi:hypothetical protein